MNDVNNLLVVRELTEKEYQVLSDLYNELNDAFRQLSTEYQQAFYARLYRKD